MAVKKYDEKADAVTIECFKCAKESTHGLKNFGADYMEEFGQYTNLVLVCPHCKDLTIININIPEFEEQELEAAALYMPDEEINARNEVRRIQWRKRPDLAKKDRAAEIAKFRRENAAAIARAEQSVEEIIKQREGRGNPNV